MFVAAGVCIHDARTSGWAADAHAGGLGRHDRSQWQQCSVLQGNPQTAEHSLNSPSDQQLRT